MKIKLLIFILAVLSSGLSQGMTWEEWAESRHPPSDKGPLPDGCSPVKYRGGFHPIVEYVSGSGNHCVIHDFVQRKLRDFINGRVRGSPTDEAGQGSVISFSEDSHSNIDLRKHLISGRPFENTRGIGMDSKSPTHLAVHNGVIETPGPLGIGIDLAPYIEGRQRLQELTEDRPAIKEVGYSRTFAGIWDYTPPTFYTAENLQIKSGGRAIIMAGSDNVVRNNTVEVNTFIVHMDPRDKAPLPAILKLRDADGSIIRNNRFIVKRGGLFRKKEEEPQAGINLLESKDVVIEGNVFEQVAVPVRKDEASTTMEDGNAWQGGQ
jgi:hypothetical protein